MARMVLQAKLGNKARMLSCQIVVTAQRNLVLTVRVLERFK